MGLNVCGALRDTAALSVLGHGRACLCVGVKHRGSVGQAATLPDSG